MDDRTQKETWLTAAECSRRIGLSVRALRLYEDRGLIFPRRTAKQWRLYGVQEIARLNEIRALKALGLSLSGISTLLKGQTTDLKRTLVLQHDALREARNRIDRGLGMIDTLQAKIVAGGEASMEDLMGLARETTMTESSKDTLAWHRYEQSRPRTEVKIDTSVYDDYAGYYELEDGPYYIDSHREGRLFTRIVGQSDLEIFPESDTQFFMKVLPVQVTFVRDPDGSVRSLVHHQNGMDDKGFRAAAELVKAAEEDVQGRIRQKIAMPCSDNIVRKVIEDDLRGEPDFDGMSPPLAALVREQYDDIQADMKKVGRLKDVAFKGVSQAGLDIYEVQFENASMEWGFALAPSGKISHLYSRFTP
jgi:DNA-binding transcriptional MerR regulator